MTIDFESMKVGDAVELTGHEWETGPQQQFDAAQEFIKTHQDRQFQVETTWRMNTNRGFEERVFTLTRTR